jgi:hypothetical protein
MIALFDERQDEAPEWQSSPLSDGHGLIWREFTGPQAGGGHDFHQFPSGLYG